MGHAAAVADDEQARVAGLEVLVQLDLHVIELHLHAIEQGVVVGGAGGDLVQGVDHLDDAVQDALGHHQAQVAGGGGQGGGHEALLDALGGGPLAPDQVAEALDDDAAAQHVGQPGDALAVAVGILEGLGEVLGHQQGEVGVLGVHGRVLIAVAVDGDDAVGVLVDHRALGVHAEGAHPVLELLGAVDDLAFIQLVGQVGEHLIGQLHPDTDVHPVGPGGDVQLPAHLLHPLAAAAAHGDDAVAAVVAALVRHHPVAAVGALHGLHRRAEVDIHPVLQPVIQVLQHHQVLIRAQVADRGVQQVQVVLQAQLLDGGCAGGVQVGPLAAVCHVDFVHIFHQLQGLLFADVFVQGAAELVGDVVFAVGKGPGPAEAVHNGAGGALDAGLHLHAVNGTVPPGQGVARLKQGDLQVRPLLQQLIGGINSAGASAHDQHIILHSHFLLIHIVIHI